MRTFLQLKWDFVAIGLLVVGFYVASTEFSSSVRPAEHPFESGSRPPDRLEGDVLLLLPSSPRGRARTFDEIDTSYVWYNLLWQHVGTFASIKLDEMSPEVLAGRAAVIVPKSVAAQMTEIGFDAITSFASAGGTVVVEMPGEGWIRRAKLGTVGSARRASYAKVEWRGGEEEIPLVGLRIPVPDSVGDTTLRVDEAEGIVVTTSGHGRFVSVLFDFAKSLLALQQGVPSDGMMFGGMPTSSRSKSGPRSAPVADLLEHALVSTVSSTRPIPKVWKYPGQYRGAAMVLHPMFGDDISKARILGAQGPGTLFLPPEHRVDGGRACVWSDSAKFSSPSRTLGIFETQEEKPADVQLKGCVAGISFGFRWQKEWLLSMQRFASAETYVDFSLVSDAAGFSFGTTYPYYPIDDRGLPLPILTMPVLLRDGQLAKIADYLEPEPFSSPLTISAGVESMTDRPSAAILRELSALSENARLHQLWLTSPSDFINFVSARRSSVMTSRWDRAQKRLVISVRIAKALDLPPVSIAIPVANGIESVSVDDERVSLSELAVVERHRILSLDEGRHTIEVVYSTTHHAVTDDNGSN